MSFNFLFHSKFYRAQDSNLDLLEINVIQLSLPLDEHDFSFDEIAEKIFFIESSRTKSIRIINFLWHFYVCVLRTVSTDFRMWGFFILQLAVPCVVSIGNNPYQIQLIKKTNVYYWFYFMTSELDICGDILCSGTRVNFLITGSVCWEINKNYFWQCD